MEIAVPRALGWSALVGALSGAVLGPFLLADGLSLGAAVSYGVLGGLLTGALVGCLAGAVASAAALLASRRGRSVAAVFAGTAAAVTGLSVVLLLPPYRAGVTALIGVAVTVWTAVLGRVVARRSTVR